MRAHGRAGTHVMQAGDRACSAPWGSMQTGGAAHPAWRAALYPRHPLRLAEPPRPLRRPPPLAPAPPAPCADVWSAMCTPRAAAGVCRRASATSPMASGSCVHCAAIRLPLSSALSSSSSSACSPGGCSPPAASGDACSPGCCWPLAASASAGVESTSSTLASGGAVSLCPSGSSKLGEAPAPASSKGPSACVAPSGTWPSLPAGSPTGSCCGASPADGAGAGAAAPPVRLLAAARAAAATSWAARAACSRSRSSASSASTACFLPAPPGPSSRPAESRTARAQHHVRPATGAWGGCAPCQ